MSKILLTNKKIKTMNNHQKLANEKFFISIMRFGSIWFWPDMNESYKLIEGKFKPMTQRGYLELSKIVTRSFMEQYVLPVT
jgi:hypothetical protein